VRTQWRSSNVPGFTLKATSASAARIARRRHEGRPKEPMAPTLVCLSHLRWHFVYQRPNHLMARAARRYDVLFVEEPIWDEGPARVELERADGLTVVRPHLPRGDHRPADETLSRLLADLLAERGVHDPVVWYYTPMALPWMEGVSASVVVYDCMDELSAFRGAPPALVELEARLLQRADLVFTGGRQLFEAKRDRAANVHCFPSSVEYAHFAQARKPQHDPPDQAPIARPRIGYFGVVDERLDLDLIGEVARTRPEWQLVLVGPIAKIDVRDIPALPNVHHLGMKPYEQLPAYLAGWDVAMMPFARNEATRYISPTKTPEYLAGGKPVVSTSIRDVVEPYARLDLVRIADTAAEMVDAIEAALAQRDDGWIARADGFLASQSWAQTWQAMDRLISGMGAAPDLGRSQRLTVNRSPRDTATREGAIGGRSGRSAVLATADRSATDALGRSSRR
jgi:glycosyltransferase involved in cell wall biosynthesis